jgi:phosphoglycolate phosphatase-like HAD superfamily hydrolase
MHYRWLMDVDDLVHLTACGHGKPDPRLIELALRKLIVRAGEAILIGDTPYDAEAALSAGAAADGLLTGGFARQALVGAGCLILARGLQEFVIRFETERITAAGK